MKTFEYTIKDELGIHARPAGLLVKEAKKFESECTITKDGKTKKLTQLMMLMSLGVKQGDILSVNADTTLFYLCTWRQKLHNTLAKYTLSASRFSNYSQHFSLF